MKIVILDGYTENPGDLSWDALRAFGSVTVYDRTPDDDAVIAGRIGGAEIVLTNKCPIRRAVLEACPTLKYISVLATGYNIVDVHAGPACGKAGTLHSSSGSSRHPPLGNGYRQGQMLPRGYLGYGLKRAFYVESFDGD